jgi:hypothetical protein
VAEINYFVESMPALYLIIFKTPFFKKMAHWGFLLPNEGNCSDIVSVKKAALHSKRTEIDYNTLTTDIERNIASYHPLNINIEIYTLNQVCQNVSRNRHFDLFSRNCQHWVLEVLEELVRVLNISTGREILNRVRALPHMCAEE